MYVLDCVFRFCGCYCVKLKTAYACRISDWSSDVCSSDLNRLWQLLLKGHDEVLRANNPLEHLEMLLLRVIYAASLPDPGELAKRIEAGGISALPPAPTGTTGGPEPSAALAEAPASALTIAQIHQLLESGGHHTLARQVHDDLRIVTLEPDRKSTRLNSSH